MKLILSLAALIAFLIMQVKTQNHQHEQYPFPPQFQTPGSDNSHYLPPENHSPLPYFPMKNFNNLQFPYLPPTGTKAPAIYPTPFPMVISSNRVPNFDENEDDDIQDLDNGKIRFSSPQPPRQFNNQLQNRTDVYKFNERPQNGPQDVTEKKEPRNLQKPVSYVRHPIERADTKMQIQLGAMQSPVNQTPATRRMMIAEMGKDQALIQDQVKTASYQGLQYLQAPAGFLSSTTEPAIPIIRLSNEMDLDGSYSYEALGADQTHYVQHSRMENMGSDKEEQVVEGSYSYVGDNGQTFTVHYVADSNGFRASGDHLPVAPPIPEIIQRAVQYNLAEEARRPPGSKPSWEEESNDGGERNAYFAPPPTRSLFTGKTPEAFSYSYSHQPQANTNAQNSPNNNNQVPAASNQVSIKTVDFSNDQTQSKPNNGPISPQITFLASQGAHLPSSNLPQQQSISRMFTTEKMPQLMNYEANIKETESESNKGLWRWQYGANAENVNTNSNKNSISRSFGDDVMINFDDMTQEEYTNMIRSQLEQTDNNNQGIQHKPEDSRFVQYTQKEQSQINNNPFNEIQISHDFQKGYQTNNLQMKQGSETSWVQNLTQSNEWYENHEKIELPQNSTGKSKDFESRKFIAPGSHPNIITQKHFIPQSQTVTQSYDYDDPSFYDVRKIKSHNLDNSNIMSLKNKINHDILQNKPEINPSTVSNANENHWINKENNNFQQEQTSTLQPNILTTLQSDLKFTDFIIDEKADNFKPLISITTPNTTTLITTTESSIENIFENNIFLKNLVRSNKNNAFNQNSVTEHPKKQVFNNFNAKEEELKQHKPIENTFKANIEEINYQNQPVYSNTNAEPKADKTPKFLYANEMSEVKKKPLDMSEVLNYVAHKNSFEFSKIKPKPKTIIPENLNPQKRELYYTNNQEEDKEYQDEEEQNKNYNKIKALNRQQQEEIKGIIKNYKVEHEAHKNNNNGKKPLNLQQQQELKGIIKNYKVLHRNHHVNHEQNNVRKENSIPYRILQMQSSNLPPLGRAGPTVKAYLPPIYV